MGFGSFFRGVGRALGNIGSGAQKFGSFVGKAAGQAAAYARPVANLVGMALDGAGMGGAGSVVRKIGGRTADIASKIQKVAVPVAGVGNALRGVMGG